MLSAPNKILVLLLVSFVVAGIVENLSINGHRPAYELAVVHAIAIAILLFAWCKAHARFNNIAEPGLSAILTGLIAPIGVPLYFYRGFGFKQGSIKTLKAIGFFLAAMLVYEIGAFVSDQIGS